MRIFKLKAFARIARKSGIDDKALRDAVDEVERGLIDADLGGGVIKKRVARHGGGKRGGHRTLILYRRGSRAVFAYGFAKNERENISDAELEALKDQAAIYLGFDDGEIKKAIEAGGLAEVTDDGEEV